MKIPMAVGFAVLLTVAALAGDFKRLDEGTLDPAWFGGPLAFRETENVDYLWVKEGFTVKGKTVFAAPWEDHVFLGDKRDAKDAAVAVQLTDTMPALIRGALSNSLEGVAKTSKEGGDLEIVGRFVDVNAGNNAAKIWVGMGAGSGYATWDLKIVDKATGEMVVAIHHRSVSGTMMSDVPGKIVKWLADFGDAMRADFAEYAKGKPRKK